MSYYETHAKQFFDTTVGVEMQTIYERFVPTLSAGARVLDAGCGSGRDALYFAQHGFEVDAFDASPALVEKARAFTGLEVELSTFANFRSTQPYDGIWSCASLLHVPDSDWLDALNALTGVLKPGGVWYMSFKYGDGARTKDGRFFRDQTEESLAKSLAHRPELQIESTWRTADLRPNRSDEFWLNALVRRKRQ